MAYNTQQIDLFIAYSRKDQTILDELVTHLIVLPKSKLVNEIWYDGLIDAGSKWEAEIQENLDRADIILLLVSSHFIRSCLWNFVGRRPMCLPFGLYTSVCGIL